MAATKELTEALEAMGRGEDVSSLSPFRSLAAIATRGEASRHQLDELVQNLLVALLKMRRDKPREWRKLVASSERPLRAWLLQRLRWDFWGGIEESDLVPIGWLTSLEGAVDRDEATRLRRAIDGGRLATLVLGELTEREALVLVLRYEGKSPEEVAGLLGVGRSTVYEIQRTIARKVEGGPRSSPSTRLAALRQLVAALKLKKKGGR